MRWIEVAQNAALSRMCTLPPPSAWCRIT